MVAVTNERALNLESAKRIGTVKHYDLYPEFAAGLHDKAKRADESVGAHTDVLYVIDYSIKPLQHLCSRLA